MSRKLVMAIFIVCTIFILVYQVGSFIFSKKSLIYKDQDHLAMASQEQKFIEFKEQSRQERQELYEQFASEFAAIEKIKKTQGFEYNTGEFAELNVKIRGADILIKQNQKKKIKNLDCSKLVQENQLQCQEVKSLLDKYLEVAEKLYDTKADFSKGYSYEQRLEDQSLTYINWSLDAIYSFKLQENSTDLTH